MSPFVRFVPIVVVAWVAAGAASAQERWRPVQLTRDDFAAVEMSSLDRTTADEPAVRLVMVRRIPHQALPADYMDTRLRIRCETAEFRLKGVTGRNLDGTTPFSDPAETDWARIGDTSAFYGAYLGLCRDRWTDAPASPNVEQFVRTARAVWAQQPAP